MEIKFKKDHGENKTGDVITVDDARANYWFLMGVAEKVEMSAKKEKVEINPAKEKKQK